MNSFLLNLTNLTEILNPILLFCVLISAISFMIYLKGKVDVYFESVRRIAVDIERIANKMDNNNYY